jgi:uncharacterized protein YjlB
MKSKRTVVLAAVVAALGAASLYAQQAGFTRKMLQDHDVGASDRHAVQMLEGTLEVQIVGQPPRTLNAGEVFFIPAGVVHEGKNAGGGAAKVLATYVAEKGKPLASPAN